MVLAASALAAESPTPVAEPRFTPTPQPTLSEKDRYKSDLRKFERRIREERWDFEDSQLEATRSFDDEKRKAEHQLILEFDDRLESAKDQASVKREWNLEKEKLGKVWQKKREELRKKQSEERHTFEKSQTLERKNFSLGMEPGDS
jgi:hypothetical protein